MTKSKLSTFFSNLSFQVDWAYSRKELEFSVNDESGDVDYDKTEEVLNLLHKTFPNIGGFRTGYGAWVLSPGYKSKGDWNDPSSAHHY